MAERPNFLVFMTDQEQEAVARPEHPCRTPYAERRDLPRWEEGLVTAGKGASHHSSIGAWRRAFGGAER